MNNMNLLPELEGRTGNYLARGQGVRTEHSDVRPPRAGAIFLVRPLTQSISILRVSMGLTVSRKTAKNLAVRRKNERILSVSRYKILTVNRKSHYPIVTLLTVSRKKAKNINR